jgi:hypothetical protein
VARKKWPNPNRIAKAQKNFRKKIQLPIDELTQDDY